uniref:BHLH domain-containing protein n=1 Tax=Oryza barthii TaxID=65489 RepID=A0A0D3F7B4_9ORYZ
MMRRGRRAWASAAGRERGLAGAAQQLAGRILLQPHGQQRGAEAHHHHHHPSMAGSGSGSSSGGRKMKSQLSFTAGPPHLSHIAEDGAFPDRAGAEASVPRTFSAGGGFSIVGPWEESRDIISTLGGYESQFGGMASTSALEMAGMDRYLQLQHDQVPFKVRAKRGCATHPRSIAERERRTRISEKLRKLQELVPNMDKQTSTADMLDLAVEHIKGLQSQLQALKHEQEKCTCCSRP